tara:strand:- start:300 stop:1142 length:843 start_codon:yes stop_codon:yes gene_type:complete
MAISKINNIAYGSLGKFKGVTVANLGKMTNVSKPVSDATFADAKSLNFDGANDFVDISDFEFIHENISISWWAKPNSAATGDAMIFASPDISDGVWWRHFVIQYLATEGIRWYFGDGSNYWFDNTGDVNFTDAWHHFVWTAGAGPTTRFQEVPLVLYMDGNVVYSDSSDSGLGGTIGSTTAMKLYVGKDAGASNHWNGNINDVAFFNTILDADAVTAIYNSGDPTDLRTNSGDYDNSANLTGYWWMGDEDTHPTITDRTSEGNDGTMTNMVSGDIETEVP